MFIAKNYADFSILFISQLKNMLSADALGSYILVLANSRQNLSLHNALAKDLPLTFNALKANFLAKNINAPQDDIAVFEKLLHQKKRCLWQHKTLPPWQVTCNNMRKLRPPRAAGETLSSIKQPFNPTKFHFNKSFLQAEILWQGKHNGVELKVLFNKFPFADYHLLIVVAPEKNMPQLLTKKYHDYSFALVNDLAESFSGFGIGFNSLAAGASVNHLHFQGFISSKKLAIEQINFLHNGGTDNYPIKVKRFANASASWAYIEQLIKDDTPFNCIYRAGFCYVVARKYSHTALPVWLTGAGWFEVAGTITVANNEKLNQLDAKTISQGLALL